MEASRRRRSGLRQCPLCEATIGSFSPEAYGALF
jgi:hypothetical protein